MKSIKEQWGNCSSLAEKMQTLRRKCETLCSREADIITELQHEESFSRKKRRNEVENWLVNVERTRNGVQSIEREASGSGILGCIQLAKHVENLSVEVVELMDQGKFPKGLVLNAHEARGEALLTTRLIGQAIQNNMESIWEYLTKDEVLTIGIWGMGGVGKTTLVTHIHNRVCEQTSTFEDVYWVSISQNHSIRSLQDDISETIDLDLSYEEDEKKRAAMLSRELARRKRCVLILDDVWEAIHLEKVGVLVKVNGCKLIITTRSLEVCRRLGCQEKIKVEPLSEEEAWYLFMQNLGQHLALSTDVLDVAKCVARECAGLPLGIITVSRCMREVNDIYEWRDALQALRESKAGLEDMEKGVFQVLKFSYSRLNDPKLQQCFLYCALYPEGEEINRDELINRCIDEGLIDIMRNGQAGIDRGHAMLNKLVNICLLESVEHQGVKFVKMHDLVRDMAINMSPRFMVRTSMRLCEIPKEQEWSGDLERASLIGNVIKEIASDTSPRCPKLLTLMLSRNHLRTIESSFFEHMPSLQVLDISQTNIEVLPGTISNLKNLSSLLLNNCNMLQYMPSLAELKSLKFLDLSYTSIRKIPHGLEKLINLRYLDLYGTNLKVFPTGVLPKLSRLEYLILDRESGALKVKGEELGSLERLSTFRGHLCDDLHGFNAYIMSRRYQGPRNYYFRVDGDIFVDEGYNCHGKHVSIENYSIRNRSENLQVLKNVQSLQIFKCNDMISLCDASLLNTYLKQCKICHCEGIEYLGSFSASSCSASSLLFQEIEILSLEKLSSLRSLFTGQGGDILPSVLPHGIFACLKQFSIDECPKIKKLFQPRFLPHLRNLEQIEVRSCEGLEEIIASESNHCTAELSLPRLRILSLGNLPELRSICSETIPCKALKMFKVWFCPELKRIPISHPQSLTKIRVFPEQWWESVEWNVYPNAKTVLEPYVKFEFVMDKDEDNDK